MFQKPKKAVGAFINDHTPIIHIHKSPRMIASPRVEQRCPFTINNHNSKTKFIEASSIVPEGPRAIAVTGTGEKHYIPWEEPNTFNSSSMNAFKEHGPSLKGQSKHISQLPVHKEIHAGSKTTENTCKLVNASRVCTRVRRHLPQKVRLTFTPRRDAEKVSSHQLLYNVSKASLPAQGLSGTINTTSIRTQTDVQMPVMPCSQNTVSQSFKPVHQKPIIQSLQPLPQWTKPRLKYFQELRGIVSVVTLITVFSWLFSIFFEMEVLTDLIFNIIQRCRSWHATEEVTKTKAELAIQFLTNLWS